MLLFHDPETLYLAFWNFNFGTRQSQDEKIVKHALETYDGLQMLGGVETKVDNFHTMFNKRAWRVYQNTSRDYKKNIAVAYLKGTLHKPRVRGLRLGVTPHGVKMLTRPLRIVDLSLYNKKQKKWQRCRFIFGHRPPERYRFLQPLFDVQVKLRLSVSAAARKGRWVLIEDFNQTGQEVARKFGGTFHGQGIDGFILGPSMAVSELTVDDIPKRKGWTDHVGVIGKLSVKH